MKSFFLLLVFICTFSQCKNETSENDSGSTSNIIFQKDFEDNSTGKFDERELKRSWPQTSFLCGKKDYLFYKLGINPHPLFIEKEDENKFLSILCPKENFRPIVGAQWQTHFKNSYNELYFSYKVKFPKDFDFVKGGKLPGLAGGTSNGGGKVPNGKDGWSARMMFWEEGKLSTYVYFPDQSGINGERFYWISTQNDTVKMELNKWHTICNRIKMNTPGKKDGIIQGWLNGQQVLYVDTIRFRDIDDLKIDNILFGLFFGGDNMDWAHKKDEQVYFDDFVVSQKPISEFSNQ